MGFSPLTKPVLEAVQGGIDRSTWTVTAILSHLWLMTIHGDPIGSVENHDRVAGEEGVGRIQ